MLRSGRAAAALAVLAAAAATLAACTEDPFAPDLAPHGEARFTFSGDTAGEFVAAGRLNRRNPNAGTWAVGEARGGSGQQVLGVFAQRSRDSGVIDGFILEWAGAQVGSATCDAATQTCPFGAYVVLGRQAASGTFAREYAGVRGTVTLTGLSADRARGTFTFTLLHQGGAAEPPSLEITGSFDVPLNVLR